MNNYFTGSKIKQLKSPMRSYSMCCQIFNFELSSKTVNKGRFFCEYHMVQNFDRIKLTNASCMKFDEQIKILTNSL